MLDLCTYSVPKLSNEVTTAELSVRSRSLCWVQMPGPWPLPAVDPAVSDTGSPTPTLEGP